MKRQFSYHIADSFGLGIDNLAVFTFKQKYNVGVTRPQRQAIRMLAEGCGLNGCLLMAGFQDDVRPYLAAADVYVQPSRREALSLAILEAMASALAVIATNVGDASRIIRDGREGYLVPSGNSSALAEKIVELLRRKGLGLGAAGQHESRQPRAEM